MSLLFDALRRAQGDGAKKRELEIMPDSPLHPPSGGNEGSARQAGGTGTGTAKTILAATHRPPPGTLPYAVAGLALLAVAAVWFFYPQNINVPIATPGAEAVSAIQPQLLAASQPGTVSSVASAETSPTRPLALASTANGTDTSADKGKSGTRPVAANSQPKRKSARKQPARLDLLASTSQDPLKEGYLALSEGRLDQAEQKYLSALAQHPHEKDALLGLAVVAQRKMQMERAADLYRQVLREDLGNATAAAGLVSLSAQADPLAAESQLRELLDIKPSAPEFHYALGGVLARQLRWGEAQQAFFRACSLNPGNALYAYNLAVSLDRLHQSAAALPYYEKASRLARPNDPTLDRDAIQRRIQELSDAASR